MKRQTKVARKSAKESLPVEYHIVPNGRRWDVERDDSFIGSFAYDVNTAIGSLLPPRNAINIMDYP